MRETLILVSNPQHRRMAGILSNDVIFYKTRDLENLSPFLKGQRESLLLMDEKIGTKEASKARNIEQSPIGSTDLGLKSLHY